MGATGCHEGMGGGGAAGTVLLDIINYSSTVNVKVKGGKGGDMVVGGNNQLGLGGGGSAGVCWVTSSSISPSLTVDVTPGANGVNTLYANDPWGATGGQIGQTLLNLVLPVGNIPFQKNIDSVKIKDSAIGCFNVDLTGFAFTNNAPIASWHWIFGDGNFSNSQNVQHSFANGTYNVKLIVTDLNGCIDSAVKQLIINNFSIIKSNDTTICKPGSAQLLASGGITYSWSPTTGLSNPFIPNPIASPVTTTTYIVTVTDGGICTKTDSVKVIVSSINLTKSPDTTICKNASAQIFASGGVSYHWSPTTGLNNPTIPNPVATPLVTTTYKVIVTNSTGCSKTDSIKITVTDLVYTKSNDTTVCRNTPAQLVATGGSSYFWAPATGLSNPNIGNPIAIPDTTRRYKVSITLLGCTKIDSVLITTYPKPFITKSNDTTICKNKSVQLFATGGQFYLWSPAATLSNPNIPNPIALPTDTTTYTVIITDNNTCTTPDSVKVSVRAAPVFTVGSPSPVCSGNPRQLSASGGDLYAWQPAGLLNNPTISNPIATSASTTSFTVKIRESTCMDSTIFNTTLIVLPLPVVDATKVNDIDCSNNSSQLNATGASQYLWSPGADLNNPLIANPVATSQSTTLYTVTGTDPNGCKNIDTITVFVIVGNNGLHLMPNAFTPNGDGINDCYGISNWGLITELDFSIWNRYGERIFHTTTSNTCWDGTYKGKKQNIGAYVYLITAKTPCENVFRKGTLFLLR